MRAAGGTWVVVCVWAVVADVDVEVVAGLVVVVVVLVAVVVVGEVFADSAIIIAVVCGGMMVGRFI